jgi:predicted transcriptional regulator of viral defense system
MKVYYLVKTNKLKQVHPRGIGLYTLPEIDDGEAQFSALAKYFPKCVVSGKTALSLYGLADEYINKIHVDIPKTTNLKNDLFEVTRVHPDKIFEVIEKTFQGVPIKIKIYSPERCLYEAYKFGDRSEIYLRALKRYRQAFLRIGKEAFQYKKIELIDKKLKSKILRDIIMEDVGA